MNLDENNILIRDFIDGMALELEDIDFHNNWNLLSWAIEKIESLGYFTEICGGRFNSMKIGKDNYELSSFDIFSYTKGHEPTKKDVCYRTVVEFIKLYNENRL